jgi:Protein of unknown function (DUF732)
MLVGLALKGLLLGLMAVLAFLGAALSGIGTAHAYTDSEQQYLMQLNELQAPGSDQTKLANGYAICDELRGGAQPWPEVYSVSRRSGMSVYYSTNELLEATAWLCPDQNWKSDKAFQD